ncbi:helix-turn-helix domain-containing protein [Amycolatopsis tolypomycina]|uniref:helix-turn-helix domain-containing protein n=1 Tax=Amycolatopsis tolypomycina TaxID=208445 RepID=UPI001FC9A018|nr:helix-turn-helix domain-containing protein [Amycolatopsis tolypomycina]
MAGSLRAVFGGRSTRESRGGTIDDPTDPMSKMFFSVLATFAEFEVDLLRAHTRGGMAIARAKGKRPKLSPAQQRHLLRFHREGKHNVVELAELFNVSRPTVYRAFNRAATSPARATR